MASRRSSGTGRPFFLQVWVMRERASGSISTGRSRSGGMTSGMPLRRKNRSSRNVPAATSASRSRLVAATNRTSISFGFTEPTRVTLRSSSTRRSFTCVAGPSSPTSSRNTVPPCADSRRPALACTAPVNAPRSWPKSSLSSRLSLNAAQLSFTNGWSRRGERWWIVSARISLPTPVSPSSSTEIVESAMRSASP